MTRKTKVTIAVASAIVLLPIFAIGGMVLVVSLLQFESPPGVRREITLANHGKLIIDGQRHGRSEHGFSQRAGYRPSETANIEWFGELSDGVDPRVHETGSLVVVIDVPAAVVYARTRNAKWTSLALVFPNDLGPSLPISYYAERSGLTTDEVSRIDELGGKRAQKWPTTYIQSFDPQTRDLKCDYHVDNKSSWPLHLRLSEDGTHLALIAIGESSP